MLPNSMEDAALNSHLAAQDRAEAADGMTYRELLNAREEASENNAWALMDDLRREIESRKTDARIALRKAFIDAADEFGLKFHWGRIPQIVNGVIAHTDIADWIRESANTNQYSEMMVDMLLGTRTRDSIIAAMADEYVELVCEDLLLADYQPE